MNASQQSSIDKNVIPICLTACFLMLISSVVKGNEGTNISPSEKKLAKAQLQKPQKIAETKLNQVIKQ
ncbi:hypothetical protein [Methyloglobulus sp.]|uniref:hypothetical protein n=1 Tax=Methyloglobulus sp. TaxID=2518622 RepID=UPI0032B77761